MGIEIAIREYLINHGIKQAFVAEKCGWSKQKTNAIMTGKQKINQFLPTEVHARCVTIA